MGAHISTEQFVPLVFFIELIDAQLDQPILAVFFFGTENIPVDQLKAIPLTADFGHPAEWPVIPIV